jgi:lipopolysaccharide transport system permease protein
MSSDRRSSADVRPQLGTTFRAAVARHELLQNLIQRDLRARYRRSVIGWGWSLVNPLVNTIVYFVVFVVFLKIKPDIGDPSGQSFYPFYLLSGLLPWNFLVNSVSQSATALVANGSLIAKVKFPREHLVFSIVLSLAVTLVVELGVLAALVTISGTNILPFIPVILFLVFLMILFGSGLSLIIAALHLRYRDTTHLVGIGFLLWFYLTPIVYPASRIPEQTSLLGVGIPLRHILSFNPMFRFVQTFRNCLFDGRLPGFETMATLIVMSMIVFVGGYRYFISRSPWFAEEL